MASPISGTPRKPRRLGRKLLLALLGLIALVVVILAILPYVISLESIKGQVTARAEAALHRKVDIGQVRLQILSGLGAGLEQLTVHNSEGWEQPHFVKVGTVSIKVAFLPLLQRKIEITRMILRDGDIFIERDAEGRLNYGDLIAPQPKAAAKTTPPGSEVGPLAGLLVSKISLQNVNVTFVDRMVIPGQTLTTMARDLQVDIRNMALNTPIDFDLSMALLSRGGRNLRLQGRLGPIPESLAFDRVPIEVTFQAENLLLDPVTPYLGSEPALSRGRLNAEVQIHGNLGGRLDLKGRLALAEGVMPDTTGTGKPVQLPTVTLTPELTVDLGQALLQVARLRLDLAPLQVSLKGTVRTFTTTPQLDLQLSTNDFAVAELLAQWPQLGALLPASTEVKGHLQLQARATGTPTRLQSSAQMGMRQLAVKLADGTTLTLPKVGLMQDATVDLGQALLQVARLRLDLAPLQVSLKGTVRTFTTTPQLDVQLSTNNFAPAAVLAQLPMLADALPTPHEVQGRVQLRGSIKGTPEKLRSETHLKAESLSVKSGSFSGAKSGGGMHFETAGTRATLVADLNGPRPPDVRLDLQAQRLVFDQKAAAAAPTPKPAAPPESAPKPTVPPLNLRGKVTIAEGRIKQFRFRNLTADLSLIDGLLKSTQHFTTYGGTFQGQMLADLNQTEPDYTVVMQLADVKAGSLVHELTSVRDVVFGNLNTKLKFSGRGFGWSAISKTLTGRGNLQIANLKLTTLDLMPKLALGLQGAGKLAGFSVPADLAERSFDTLQGAFRIVQGKLHTDNLKLRGKDLELRARGVLGLDQSLDFEGTAFLLGNLVTTLGNRAAFLRDQQGRIRLPFRLQGTVTQPQIIPDQTYLMELARKSLTRKVQDKAGKKLQQLLQKTPLGKTRTPEASTAAPKKQESPEQVIKKTFKGLFKR